MLYCSSGSLLFVLFRTMITLPFRGIYGMPSKSSSSAISLDRLRLSWCVLCPVSPRRRPWALTWNGLGSQTLWPHSWKIQSNRKWFLLTVNYQHLKCKIVYTSILLSNHLHPHFHPKRERERERERPLTWTPARLPIQPSPSRCRLKLEAITVAIIFQTQRRSFSSLFLFDLQTISSSLPPSDPPTDLIAVKPTRRSCHHQTHPLICGPLPLSLSMCLFFRKIEFFLLIWFIYLDFLL